MANAQWWAEKLQHNRTRDERVNQQLAQAGWLVLRFWEHDDPVSAADVVEKALHQRRCNSDGRDPE